MSQECTQNELQSKLVRMRGLSDDWDSYCSRKPSREALEALETAITYFAARVGATSRLLETLHFHATSGGAHIEWDHDGRCLEVEINEAGRYRVIRIPDEVNDSEDEGHTVENVLGLRSDIGWLFGARNSILREVDAEP